MSSEYNIDLHILHKRKDLKLLLLLLFFLAYEKGGIEIFENNGSLINKRGKFVQRHNRNIKCQWKSLS